MSNSRIEPPQPSSGAIWAWVPAGLLSCMLAGLGTLAYIAIDDPHFALEPDYYDKALHWDRAQAEARDGQALGLKAELTEPLWLGPSGHVIIELSLKTRHDQPVLGASIRVQAFPNAFATRVQQLQLQEVGNGRYRAELSHATVGLWELRCAVTSGTSHQLLVLRPDVKKGAA